MEPILDYLDVNTVDIWTFEANQYLTNNRTDEHIIKVKSALELQIVISRREQINNNLSVTINPIVTIDDYDNGVNKDYWVRLVREIGDTKTIHERVNLGYFNVFDAGLDSFFSLEQYILIHKDNEQFDFWFALKLSQFKSGIKYIPDFLNYQMQEVFNFDVVVFCEFLEVVILQYKDEFIDEKVCLITEKWILSQRVEISEEKDSFSANGEKNDKPTLQPLYKSFYSDKLKYLKDNNKDSFSNNMSRIFDMMGKSGFINKEDNTYSQFIDLFITKAVSKNRKIKWTGSAYELRKFTDFIAKEEISNEIKIKNPEKWEIVMHCFQIKLKGKQMGPILNKTSISGAKPRLSDKIEKLDEIVKNLKNIVKQINNI